LRRGQIRRDLARHCGQHVARCGQRGGQRTFERQGEHLVHLIDKVELDGVLDVVGQLGDVLLVGARQDDFEDAGAQGGQQLLLQSADGQHLAAQRDLAGHGDVAAHGNLGQGAGQCGGHGDAGRRAVLGDCAFRHVQMQIHVAIKLAAEAERLRLAADVAERGLGRLLHPIAQLAGNGEFSLDYGLHGDSGSVGGLRQVCF